MTSFSAQVTDLFDEPIFISDLTASIREWEHKVDAYPCFELWDSEENRLEANSYFRLKRANARYVLNQLYRLKGYPFRLLGEIQYYCPCTGRLLNGSILDASDEQTMLVRYWNKPENSFRTERIPLATTDICRATFQTPLSKQTRYQPLKRPLLTVRPIFHAKSAK